MPEAPITVLIRKNSTLARLAAFKLGKPTCALVLGRTLHLFGCSPADFLTNETWVRHEAAHVIQFQRMGFVPFLWRYVWYSLRYGYAQNPLEREAREAEQNPAITEQVCFIENLIA